MSEISVIHVRVVAAVVGVGVDVMVNVGWDDEEDFKGVVPATDQTTRIRTLCEGQKRR